VVQKINHARSNLEQIFYHFTGFDSIYFENHGNQYELYAKVLLSIGKFLVQNFQYIMHPTRLLLVERQGDVMP
jgi:hypothetical protein